MSEFDLTAVVVVSLSLLESESAVSDDTLTVLESTVPRDVDESTFTTSVKIPSPPAGNDPAEQVTVLPEVQVNPAGAVIETKLVPGGSAAWTCEVTAAEGPPW